MAPQPLEGGTRVLASLAVALATFMNVLDTWWVQPVNATPLILPDEEGCVWRGWPA